MNTKRLRFQEYSEGQLGCLNPEEWTNFKSAFMEYSFSSKEAERARKLLLEDAADLYYKSCLSLCKALNSLYRGFHSWSVVNLYYSCFYSMNAHLAVLGVGLVRNKNVFSWRADVNCKPTKINARSDHQAVIKTFKNMSIDDVLQTNRVDGRDVYEWLALQRNNVQYRDRSFSEPEQGYFHQNLFSANEFEAQVLKYILDDIPIYCFDGDHSMVAAPIKRLLDTKTEFRRSDLPNPIGGRTSALDRLLYDITKNRQSGLYGLLRY